MKHEPRWQTFSSASARVTGQLNAVDTTPVLARMPWVIREVLSPISIVIVGKVTREARAMHRKGKR